MTGSKSEKIGRKVLVIGGGASGLMAAITAAREGASVTVLEQNEKPGRKILASGNGKCNLSNRDQAPEHYHGDAERIAAVMKRFSPKDTLRFFSSVGLRFRERNGWIYPASEQAGSVLEILLLECRHQNVKIKNTEKVTGILREGNAFSVLTESWSYPADAVVVCCGSPASAVRGADGSAGELAASLGIKTEPFTPALVPLLAEGRHLAAWAGVRAHGAAALTADGEMLGTERGELQFTDRGISGIPVFQLSYLADAAVRQGRQVCLSLDLCPEMTAEELAEALAEIRVRDPEKTMGQSLLGFLADKLIPILAPAGTFSRDPASLSEAEVFRECEKAAANIKHYVLKIRGAASMRQAQVCAGGVLLDELTDSLESRTVPGIFFAGECVDVHGDCGGYNLQWAWSSGAAAGKAAAEAAR